MFRDLSWIISGFLIIIMTLSGVCARYIDKRNSGKKLKIKEKHYEVPSDIEKPTNHREYKHPREYILE